MKTSLATLSTFWWGKILWVRATDMLVLLFLINSEDRKKLLIWLITSITRPTNCVSVGVSRGTRKLDLKNKIPIN